MAKIKIVSASDLTLVDLADLMTRGFAGYFVAVKTSTQALAQRIRREGIDLALSRVALMDERPVGLAFLALRGWTSRLAAMAVVEEARRLGLGQALVDAVLKCAEKRGIDVCCSRRSPPTHRRSSFTRVLDSRCDIGWWVLR